MQINLGELMRGEEVYGDLGNAVTATFNHVIANEDQITDAKIMAGKGGDVSFWLIKILCKDNRIPETPYDEEQVEP